MLAFPILDVVVALGFLYLLFALTCTALNEAIAAALGKRAQLLREGIEHLLGDRSLADAIYSHPSIASLARSTTDRRNGPSYIPADRFATVLTDHITGNQSLTDATALANGIQQLPAGLRMQLQTLFEVAHGDADQFRKNVAEWFEQSMDRVSGWYKRKVQRQTYVMAILIVLALNLDSVHLFNRLWSDSGFRTAAVEQARARIVATGVAEMPIMEYTGGDATDAGAPVQTGTATLTDSEREMLTSLRGWEDDWNRLKANLVVNGDRLGVRSSWFAGTIWTHLLGWLITIFAISLGAPFWFDLLNRFVNVRSAGRATDEPRTKA
jgi:hypothetical protein